MLSTSPPTTVPFESVAESDPRIEAELPLVDGLTPREQEITRLACCGMTNKEIGQTLEISHWTVATHMRRIFVKTKVNRRSALGVSLIVHRKKR